MTSGTRKVLLRTGKEDLWPGDEVWADAFTLLGIVDRDGHFVSNPGFSGQVH